MAIGLPYSPIADKSQVDEVNHPPHYCVDGLECFDIMKRAFGVEGAKTFCRFNAFKYLFRADRKNGDQDIAKAHCYLGKYLDLCKEAPETSGGITAEKRAELVEAVNNLIAVASNREVMPNEDDPEEYYRDLDALSDAAARIYHLFGTKTDWELAAESKKAEEGDEI